MNSASDGQETNETAPWVIWNSTMETLFLGRGGVLEILREPEWRARAQRAYQAGEPAWMAADGFASATKYAMVQRRADASADGLRRILRSAMAGGKS